MIKCIVLLTVLAVITSNAQALYPLDASLHIEQLLLDLRFDDAKAFADSAASVVDPSGFPREKKKRYDAELSAYKEFFEQWNSGTTAADTEQQRTILATVLSLDERYQESTAGPYSHKAFTLAVSAYRDGDHGRAFRYYRLANFSKARHFSRERFRLRNNYDQIKALAGKKEFRAAAEALNGMISNEGENPSFMELRDSVSWLQGILRENVFRADADTRRNAPRETFDRKFALAAGVRPFYTSSLHDVVWDLRTTTTHQMLRTPIGSLNGTAGVSALLQCYYYYSPSLSQQIAVEFGSMKYSSLVVDNYTVTIALEQSFVSYSTSLKYSFSELIGLRSYLAAGAGLMTMKRNEQRIYFADLIVGTARYKEYVLVDDSFASPQLTGEFGVEYFSGSLSRLFFDGSLAIQYLTTQQELISRMIISMNIRAGIFIF